MKRLMEHDRDADSIKYSAKSVANLKNAERLWIAYRDASCKAESDLYEGGSAASNIYGLCVNRLTKRRIEDIKSAYDNLAK